MIKDIQYYGSSSMGERGQIVLPAEIRKEYNIDKGEKFLILGGKKKEIWGLILVKAEFISKLVEDIFGEDLDDFLNNQTNLDAKN